MKLFYCYSPSHEGLLKNYFLPTLPVSFEPHAIFVPTQGAGDYLAPDFIECVTFKVRQILASLERLDGEIIVWSDVDLLFFSDPVAELRRLLEEQTADLLFQRESARIAGVNTGFFVCRAVEPVRRFFVETLALMAAQPEINEQFAVNELLQRSPKVRWGVLPLTYYARTHGWPPPKEAVLYHANYTAGPDGVGQKRRQFAEIRWVRRWGAPALLWSCAKRAPGKLWRMATQ